MPPSGSTSDPLLDPEREFVSDRVWCPGLTPPSAHPFWRATIWMSHLAVAVVTRAEARISEYLGEQAIPPASRSALENDGGKGEAALMVLKRASMRLHILGKEALEWALNKFQEVGSSGSRRKGRSSSKKEEYLVDYEEDEDPVENAYNRGDGIQDGVGLENTPSTVTAAESPSPPSMSGLEGGFGRYSGEEVDDGITDHSLESLAMKITDFRV
eukprot:Protomagalhaensia_sp_Gyna_25__4813@NODE_491_length_3281_cov_198_785318_g382_i0_p2_GENE_NODE_491_length_3281_cov_198_785318_g382_i0NODE_491_length_3281_cov_198_785318_g382_i0_p2_ORF_typecomplete_len214_score36_26_NODE_491_length_3281_cov_198_785318_g382_i013151956